MKSALAVSFALLLLAGSRSPARAAVPPSFSFSVAKAPHPLALDPSLSDPAWQAGRVPGAGDWQNITTRSPAGDDTVAYLLYDDTTLYVGFAVGQSSAPIVDTQVTNDVGFGTDDFVAVGIDTSGAGSQAYFFETTPRGVRYQQASENVRYRPDWRAAARVDAGGWRAVMAIPLKTMRLRPGANQTWRVGFFRNVAARGDHLAWAYDPTMTDQPAGAWPAFFDLRFWPSATGIALSAAAGTRPEPRLEIFALSSTGHDRDRYQQIDSSFRHEQTRPAGADVSVPLTPTINAVATVDPDFSNVEIDQETIQPQEFARRLAEYRPFFAQGAQYINASPYGYTNFNGPRNVIFYSPSIGPFDRGAKIEGTSGLQSFGVLSFRGFDPLTGNEYDDQAFGLRHSLQDQTFSYWADGVLAHHSIGGIDDTYEAGAAGRNVNTKLQWTLNDAVEHDASAHAVANALNAMVDVQQRNYLAVAEYVDIGPQYDPLDGFTSIADIRGPAGYINLNGTTPGVKSWSIFLQGDRLVDRSGAVHEADANLLFTAAFKNGFSVNGFGPSTSFLREYGTNGLTGFPRYADPVTVPFNAMNVPLGYGDGTPRPIDVSASWGSFGGNWLHFYTAQTSRPLGSRYTVGAEYDASYERRLPAGATDAQFLRRLLLGVNLGASSNLTLSVRGINGRGGFASDPGVNVAAALHERLRSGDLYVNFGSPSAIVTLNRLIVKYVLRIGAGAGT